LNKGIRLFILQSPVVEKKKIQENVFILKIHSPEIASIINPGQFLNIRVSEKSYPLLRRPFSVCDIENENIVLMFNILGEGTRIMASKSAGDTIDILGPLGKGFNLDGEYETAVIVAGGLGAAPFPFITRKLLNKKQILSYVGGRTSKEVIDYNLINVSKATEDDSTQFKGTVIDLLNSRIDDLNKSSMKIFGCGPTPMLKALQEFSINNNFECEISTECAMACGFGICQGCPIESTKQKEKYLLVCKDGPVFDVKDIIL
jgi:dihydroorotate dehydrogenase electron transfer subunit